MSAWPHQRQATFRWCTATTPPRPPQVGTVRLRANTCAIAAGQRRLSQANDRTPAQPACAGREPRRRAPLLHGARTTPGIRGRNSQLQELLTPDAAPPPARRERPMARRRVLRPGTAPACAGEPGGRLPARTARGATPPHARGARQPDHGHRDGLGPPRVRGEHHAWSACCATASATRRSCGYGTPPGPSSSRSWRSIRRSVG